MNKQIIVSLIALLGICALDIAQAARLDSSQDDNSGDSDSRPNTVVEVLVSCTKPEHVQAKEICDGVCGKDSCQSRQNDEASYLPVSSFCACFKMPEYNENYFCSPVTENETLTSLCQRTCPMIYSDEGDEKFTDFYCQHRQNSNLEDDDGQNEEMCTCVPSGYRRSSSSQDRQCNPPVSTAQCRGGLDKENLPTCINLCPLTEGNPQQPRFS